MSKGVVINDNAEKIYPHPYFPVGYIYLSTVEVDLNSLFGGTWEKIEGKFLLGCSSDYEAGSTGGSTEHHHFYRIGYSPYYGALVGKDASAIMAYNYPEGEWVSGASDSGMKTARGDTQRNSGISGSATTDSSSAYSVATNTQDTSSLPPYLAIYMYKKTAD